MLATLLTACGGGGGGGDSTIATGTPAPARSLALLAVSDIPAQWPDSFKTASLTLTDLLSPAQRAQTTNPDNAIFIQIWYLDQDQQRQPLAVLTLGALAGMGNSLTFANIPGGVRVLQSEVYTASAGAQQTLANRETAV